MASDRWKRIETLYHAALERPQGERSDFLGAACRNDPQLLADVESLLKWNFTTDSVEPTFQLSAGARLGHYEIHSKLGKGGMGEVWRARDATLGREVAIKTLPGPFARDADRLTRFEREAKLLASINHPNISIIHGFEEHAGTRFLVLELIEGQTLQELLGAGPLPAETALKIALQIAAALEAAHGRGIIHRDLKPGNVKVLPNGTVKVLDFGLAKALDGRTLDGSTMKTELLTRDGEIQGTPAYMSPQQLCGEPVDHQTDIWAFGCVLFEMLSGRRTFEGKTISELIGRVLRADLDWNVLPQNLHPRVRGLIEHCLEPSTTERRHSIADVRVDIQKALADYSNGAPLRPASETVRTIPARKLAWVAALGLSIVLTAFTVWILKPSDSGPINRTVNRSVIPLAENDAAVTAGGEVTKLAISRDGARIAYVANARLYIRDLNTWESRLIAERVGSVGGTPVFSPGGDALVYWNDPDIDGNSGGLIKVPLNGGPHQTLLKPDSNSNVKDIDWDSGGKLIVAMAQGIYELPESGGVPRAIVSTSADEELGSPQRLPGPKNAILYSAKVGNTWDSGRVMVYVPESDTRQEILSGGRDPRYVSTGHIVFAKGDALFAIPFDVDSLMVTGEPVQVEQGVTRAPTGYSDTAQYAVSDNGSLIHLVGDTSLFGARDLRSLVLVSRDGKKREPLPTTANNYGFARVSRDGKRIALHATGNSAGIWVYERSSRLLSHLTPGNTFFPVWNGGTILYTSRETTGLFSKSAEGGEAQSVAERSAFTDFPMPWCMSHDGQKLAVAIFHDSSRIGIGVLTLADGKFKEFLTNNANEPCFSPDGNWLALMEGNQVTIRPYPEVESRKILVAAGSRPAWAVDGSELYYADIENCLWAVSVAYRPGLTTGKKERLFCGEHIFGGGGRTWDPLPGGGFLMLETVDRNSKPQRPHIRFVQNLFATSRESR